MKLRILNSFLFLGLLAGSQVQAQDNKTGFAGDQFNLQGALEAFKQSASPEAFEKMLNRPDNKINNLDLNKDGEVDYIKVINRKDKNVQLFVLQVPVTESENQDIAVVELERTGNEEAVIQITGDEDIFGEETIVEPASDDERDRFSGSDENISRGPAAFNNSNGIFVNVWGWPSVRFVFAPGYSAWVSPWRWHYRPVWYVPHRPLMWSAWYPQRNYYHRYYSPAPRHRIVYAPQIYRPIRSRSVIVYNNHRPPAPYYRPAPGRQAPVYRSHGHYPHGRKVIVTRRR